MQVRAEPIGNDWDLEEILDVVPLKDRIISTDIVTATVCITPQHNTTHYKQSLTEKLHTKKMRIKVEQCRPK